jgi:adenine/guanine phosphoribosyltransferase-like PRPP-binding protein
MVLPLQVAQRVATVEVRGTGVQAVVISVAEGAAEVILASVAEGVAVAEQLAMPARFKFVLSHKLRNVTTERTTVTQRTDSSTNKILVVILMVILVTLVPIIQTTVQKGILLRI